MRKNVVRYTCSQGARHARGLTPCGFFAAQLWQSYYMQVQLGQVSAARPSADVNKLDKFLNN